MGTLANSEDPDEMQHDAAFHQGLHCLLRLLQTSFRDRNKTGAEILPLSQWKLGDLFPNFLKKYPNLIFFS